MKRLSINQCLIIFLTTMIIPFYLCASAEKPIRTDYAIFLFDNGEKNMIASMLKYAEENEKDALKNIDFRIVFMGAATDAMSKEPFCHYPDKLIDYRQLGIKETIDHQWKRDKRLNPEVLNQISKQLVIGKKLWTGVSCSIFEQLVMHYQEISDIEVVALRDNPSPEGDTDYFEIATEVQNAASKIAVPSTAISDRIDLLQKKCVVVGHASIEEWKDEADHIDKTAIIHRLGLNPDLPILVYAGGYGDSYQGCFERFLEMIPEKDVQVLIAPHPRYKGKIETQVCQTFKREFPYLKIVGEFMEDPARQIKTIEALCIADIVITSDATSTVVFQANALRKKVLYANTVSTEVSRTFCAKKLIYPVLSREELIRLIVRDRETPSCHMEDVFELLGIPKQGAKLLWMEWQK